MELNGICPWCGGDRLYYNPEKNVYICFKAKCRRKGKGRPPVKTWLSISKTSSRQAKHVQLPPDCHLLEATESHVSKRIVEYLDRHQVKLEELNRYGVLSTHRSLVYPFYDSQGDLVYWQERLLFSKRRFNNPNTGKGNFIFFTHNQPKVCCLVEAAISAIRIARLMPAAAFLGKPTSAQLQRLNRTKWLKEAIILLDADSYTQAFGVALGLRPDIKTTVILLPKGDPCDYTDEALTKYLQ